MSPGAVHSLHAELGDGGGALLGTSQARQHTASGWTTEACANAPCMLPNVYMPCGDMQHTLRRWQAGQWAGQGAAN